MIPRLFQNLILVSTAALASAVNSKGKANSAYLQTMHKKRDAIVFVLYSPGGRDLVQGLASDGRGGDAG